MEKIKLVEILNTKTKKDLIDLFEQILDESDDVVNILNEYLNSDNKNELTEQEKNVLEKLNPKSCDVNLTAEDKALIDSALAKHQNRKTSAVIKGANKFIASLLDYKINRYFELAWSYYSRKIGKQLGFKAFVKLVGDAKVKDLDFTCNYVLKKELAYMEYCKEHNTDEEYIMHFSTFCNSKKWL